MEDEALDADLNPRELDMAKRLVEDMSEEWNPAQYKDTFQDKIMDLVETKAREGKIEAVGGPEEAVDRRSADVIDLTELLKRSLAGKPAKKAASAEEDDEAEQASEEQAPPKRASGKSTASKKAPPKSTTSKTASGSKSTTTSKSTASKSGSKKAS